MNDLLVLCCDLGEACSGSDLSSTTSSFLSCSRVLSVCGSSLVLTELLELSSDCFCFVPVVENLRSLDSLPALFPVLLMIK